MKDDCTADDDDDDADGDGGTSVNPTVRLKTLMSTLHPNRPALPDPQTSAVNVIQ